MISASNAHDELAMASTTKLMTAYLARHDLDLDDVVTAPPYEPGGAESLMGLKPGTQVSVRDLLYGLLLASGNDAAATLAVAAAGSEDEFVDEMNATAKRLGLTQTGYENPIGFDAPGQFTTAADLVDLAIRLRRDPVLRDIVDTQSIELAAAHPERVVNRNNLVREFPFVNGVKTGYTDDAGYVLVASGTRNGVTLVSAVMGAPSEVERDAGSLALLRYGLSLYSRERAVDEGEHLAVVAIRDRDVHVPMAAEHGVELTVRRDEKVGVRVDGVPREIEGPIEAGDRLGTAVVTVDGEVEARVPLRAVHSADAANLIERIDAALPGQRLGAWGLLALGALALALVILIPAVWLVRRRR